jgi:hypothetical protein
MASSIPSATNASKPGMTRLEFDEREGMKATNNTDPSLSIQSHWGNDLNLEGVASLDQRLHVQFFKDGFGFDVDVKAGMSAAQVAQAIADVAAANQELKALVASINDGKGEIYLRATTEPEQSPLTGSAFVGPNKGHVELTLHDTAFEARDNGGPFGGKSILS